jgi:hypothetical protein
MLTGQYPVTDADSHKQLVLVAPDRLHGWGFFNLK